MADWQVSPLAPCPLELPLATANLGVLIAGMASGVQARCAPSPPVDSTVAHSSTDCLGPHVRAERLTHRVQAARLSSCFAFVGTRKQRPQRQQTLPLPR